jgi:cyclophilin family peptidyl-prolyl cis-trans isomerase/HEAT repeat protein
LRSRILFGCNSVSSAKVRDGLMRSRGHALRHRLLLPLFLGGALLVQPGRLGAQQEAVIEQLAPLLAAEDARDFRPDLYRRALVSPDSLVRRVAAIGAGRIGDLRATALLVPLLTDSDSTVRIAAAFGLGLLRDTAAVQPLIDRLTGVPPLEPGSAVEAVTALAKIGGRRVGEFFSAVLGGRAILSVVGPAPVIRQLLLESWRLGPDAPIQGLLPFTEDSSSSVRWRAVYALARLHAPAAANRLLLTLKDSVPYIRSLAARGFTRGYADAAKLAPATVSDLLVRSVADESPMVRINALVAVASYRDSTLAVHVVPLLDDPLPTTQAQAAETLGQLGGSEAAKGLLKVWNGKRSFGARRAALVALARVDTALFAAASAPWRRSSDWRERAAAAEGSAAAGPGKTPWFLADQDGRVIAAGLQAWSDAVEGPAPPLLAGARPLLAHPDAAVRSVAAEAVARAADPADLPALAAMYARTGRDSFPDAALSALAGILAIRKSGAAAQARVDREFLQTSSRPADYLIRRWAEDNWSEAADRWGAAYPISTGRTLEDYRGLVRQFLTAPDSVAHPHVTIDTEGRGPIEIELLGPDAPLTVANFLRLVDRHFFDRNRWHRVVPNFVIQDGDPRGDGFGGPGGTIRDEINRVRYDQPMLGMALSGPDTGSSQWFINLGTQPHLDGTYTVFGRVVNGTGTLPRITQGDVIRTIRR